MDKEINTIHHISSAPLNGGAGRAGYRLHEGLILQGVKSAWFQARMESDEVPLLTNWPKPKQAKKRFNFKRNSNRRAFKQAFKYSQTCATNPQSWGNANFFKSKQLPCVYNFHWMGDFLDWETALPYLTSQCPIVWTLHDMNPIQGAWHYNPFPGEEDEHRRKWDQFAVELKKGVLQEINPSRLVFVGPSKWMASECSKSPITQRFETMHIPYGLDIDAFSPINKSEAKQALNIAPNRKTIGFIADSISDPRKGIKELEDALALMTGKDKPILLTVGSGSLQEQSDHRINLGSLREDRLLRLFYSACDLFICPSLQDNLPNTVLESMACATPVIGFSVGGIPDMVRPNSTGYLANNQDVEQLYSVIKHALDNPNEREACGQRAREVVVEEYNLELQAKRYLDLYKRLKTKDSIKMSG